MKLYFFGTILAIVSHSFVLDSIVAQCPEDLNGDSQIDIKDYLQLVGKFNQSCTNPPILSFENDHSRATIGCRQGIVHKLNSGWPGKFALESAKTKDFQPDSFFAPILDWYCDAGEVSPKTHFRFSGSDPSQLFWNPSDKYPLITTSILRNRDYRSNGQFYSRHSERFYSFINRRAFLIE